MGRLAFEPWERAREEESGSTSAIIKVSRIQGFFRREEIEPSLALLVGDRGADVAFWPVGQPDHRMASVYRPWWNTGLRGDQIAMGAEVSENGGQGLE